MDVEATLAQIEERFARRDANPARGLQELLTWARAEGRGSAVLDALNARVGCPDVNAGAMFALAAGAIIEDGLPAAGLARALREPLRRALAAVAPMAAAIAQLPQSDVDDDDTVSFGDRTVSQLDAQVVKQRHPDAAAALRSLDTWYKPVVAAWTRHTAALKEAQQDHELRSSIAALKHISEGAYWLSILIDVVVDAPFVVLIPEIDEGYALDLRGVVDVGQLLILLSDDLQKPLNRINASGPASKRALAIARGQGSQEDQTVGFSASFMLYHWRAVNPATNFPEDKRFEWSAPGGVGDHSLPMDFLPGTIEPLDGARVLILVGPKAPGGFRYVREMHASRPFAALRAAIENVRPLGRQEVAAWFASIARAIGGS
jgi:hypothetical protein